jgi:endo-1,4-beta-xylanase
MYSRRETLGAILTGAALAAGLPMAALSSSLSPGASTPFGAAVQPGLLSSDVEYASAVVAHCDMIVPEGGMLWNDIRPGPDVFHFDEADLVASFARTNRLRMRGHTLAWYGAMPAWTERIETAAEAARELTTYIHRVVERYRGRIDSWDVVNEPMVDDPSGPRDLRPTIWQRRLGTEHVAMAFRAAHAADPDCRLVINEYDIEFEGPRFQRKRAAFAALIRSLVTSGAPLHGVGIQGHLRGELEIDRSGMAGFAREMKTLGLEVLVTELDVIDNKLPRDPAIRDMAAAARVRELLSAICEGSPLSAILSWGVTDKFSWVPMYFKRDDGAPNRPLPLDAFYAPKPFMKVISEFRHPRA